MLACDTSRRDDEQQHREDAAVDDEGNEQYEQGNEGMVNEPNDMKATICITREVRKPWRFLSDIDCAHVRTATGSRTPPTSGPARTRRSVTVTG